MDFSALEREISALEKACDSLGWWLEIWTARAKEAEATARKFEANIAASNAQAEEAKKIAEQEQLARVKLEEQVAPRRINLKQQKAIAALLRRFKGAHITVVTYSLDAEAASLAMQIIPALQEAGMVVEERLANLMISGGFALNWPTLIFRRDSSVCFLKNPLMRLSPLP